MGNEKIKNWVIKKYYDKKLQPFIDEHGIDALRERLYLGIYPYGYPNGYLAGFKRVEKSLNGDVVPANLLRDDIYAEYLQIPQEKRRGKPHSKISNSDYKPTIGDNNTVYKKVPLKKFYLDKFVTEGINNLNKSVNSTVLADYFGTHTIGRGFDNKGDYISYYDKWDLSPLSGSNVDDQTQGIGKPVEFYDRIYLDDYYNIPEEARGNPFITPAVVTAYKKGGRIHIKKKNRGKFTASAKRAGMGVQEFARHVLANKDKYSSTLVKRANFARNSKKFKHENGGILKAQEGTKFPAFYINFSGRPAKAGSKLKSKMNSALRTINADATHAGFMYITPDGTPVFKEYGFKNGDSYWGNRVDLSEAPKYQQGQDPQQYFLSIYKYLNPVSEGRKSEVVLIPNADSKKIEDYINSVDDTQYNLYGCNGQTCGSVAYRALSHGIGTDGSKPRGLQTLWSYIVPDGEENGQVLQHSGNYPTFVAREIDEQKEEELRNRSLTNTRNRTETQFDFSNLQDKKWYMPISLLQKDGHTCIYNGTQCVYPEHTLAQNETLILEPERHGWREIPQSEVKPGDAIILTNSKGEPKHFTTFDGVVPEGTKPYYYMNDASREDNAKGKKPRMVQPGDTLLNYSPGTPRNKTWRTHAPLFRFNSQYNTAGGDFSGPRRYFRPTGKFETE